MENPQLILLKKCKIMNLKLNIRKYILITFLSIFVIACGKKESVKSEYDNVTVKEKTATPAPPGMDYKIIQKIPHDVKAYTQGLIYYNDYIYESTGHYRHSSIRKINPETGEVLKMQKIPDAYFGEGITIIEDKIYMLTWESRLCLIINIEDFKIESTFSYSGEGWGLTDDGTSLIMSDGTNILRFIDPASQKVIKNIPVTYNSRMVSQLNELEYIEGKIWANLYGEDRIAIINPINGIIENVVDFSELRKNERGNIFAEVLNGIAYNKKTKEIYLTGKNWQNYYKITKN
jgi:glutaminyl-peptide cyclotransferase